MAIVVWHFQEEEIRFLVLEMVNYQWCHQKQEIRLTQLERGRTMTQTKTIVTKPVVFRTTAMRYLERTTWRLRMNTIKKERWPKKEKLLFLIKVTRKLKNGNKLLTMTFTGIGPHIIRENMPVQPLLGIEKRPPMSHIGHHLETGYPDGKESNYLRKEMGGHQCQERVSVMMKYGTEESGDLHLTGLKGDQDHLFQEMKVILGLWPLGLGETEGFLCRQMNKIEGPLG